MSNSSSIKVIKRYLTWDNIIFGIIILTIVCYLFFQVVILKTSSPQVAVTTTSMVPTYEGFDLRYQGDVPQQYYDILRGDLLIVQNIEPHVGDVVIFKASGETTPIVHRLVAERTVNGIQEFATKGDHNPYTDAGDSRGNDFGWIQRSAILGVVVFAIHHLGWFSLQLQDFYIRTFLIIATVGIIAFTFYESTRPESESEKQKNLENNENKKKKVYLKIKGHRIQIHRPTLFVIFFIVVLVTTYVGIGFVNYSSNQNNVMWVNSNNDEKNGFINLRTNQNYRPEIYGNLYMYDYQMNISSSGFLNTVNRIEITVVYNNLTTNVVNPTYVWTIVYDFSGTKLIHPVLIFTVLPSMHNSTINASINYKVFSSGLLASPVKSFSLNFNILI